MMQSNMGVKFDVLAGGVAVIAIHNPPYNPLNNNVMAGLETRLKEAHSRDDVTAIVLTGMKDVFSVGVDLTEFRKVQHKGCDSFTHFVPPIPFLSLIEDGPKPVVAAIHGAAVGGGLEITLACHSRVAHPNSKFSLPDLHIGVIPGLGGTQRLPRLVGVKRALEILWMKRPLYAMEAMEDGLIDEVIVVGDVLIKACSYALELARNGRSWKKTIERVDRLEPLSKALHALRKARSQAKKEHPNLVHPLLCIDVMEEGILKGGRIGAQMEEKLSHGLIYSKTAQSLMHVFFARRSICKFPGFKEKGFPPHQIRCAAVIGCGFTGAAIATSLILGKIRVVLKGENADDLLTGMKFIQENLSVLAIRGEKLRRLTSLVVTTVDYKQFHVVDIVIQAFEEEMPAWHKLFQELVEVCSPSCIFAFNSLVDLSKTSNCEDAHDRIIGVHFQSPSFEYELVEVSTIENTSSWVVHDVIGLLMSLKKLPMVVRSFRGLVVERLCFVYSTAALMLAKLGVDRGQMHACLRDFGMRKISFGFSDHKRHALCPRFDSYFDFDKIEVDSSHTHAGLSEDNALDMLLFPVVSESLKILQDGIVETPDHIDIASILGMGFPDYRGGILFWAVETVGISYITSQLASWSQTYGSFYTPYLWQDLSTIKDMFETSYQILARL